MEMARTIAMVKGKLKRSLKFVQFGAEETGLWGSNYYVTEHEDELADCRFMLNLDSCGHIGRKGFILNDVPDMNPLIDQWAEEMKAELPYIQRVSPYSDHWPFFQKGVPTASGADPAISLVTPFGHTKYDTLDKIKQDDLRRAASNYARFMFRVANHDNWNVVRKSQFEIDAFIAQQGYDETVAITDRLKEYVSKWDDIHPDTKAWIGRSSAW
jgi:Zn-dependent M28 family amino/carboxypeptidase